MAGAVGGRVVLLAQRHPLAATAPSGHVDWLGSVVGLSGHLRTTVHLDFTTPRAPLAVAAGGSCTAGMDGTRTTSRLAVGGLYACGTGAHAVAMD